MTADELALYYVNLLILQYVKKARARKTIDTLVRPVISDLIAKQVREGFDIETAVGKQLDILAEYVGAFRQSFGIDPLANYSCDVTYGDLPGTEFGWAQYGDLPGNGGDQLEYADLTAPSGSLKDADFRNLIKYMATMRAMNPTSGAEIDELLFRYFGDRFFVTDNEDMTITYTFLYVTTVADEMPTLLRAIIQTKILPRPAGVSYDIVEIQI